VNPQQGVERQKAVDQLLIRIDELTRTASLMPSSHGNAVMQRVAECQRMIAVLTENTQRIDHG
jgi:hypothetical protein